jgi:hypothetical protein
VLLLNECLLLFISLRISPETFGYTLVRTHTHTHTHTQQDSVAVKTWTCIMKIKGAFVPVLNQDPRHEDVLGVWRYRATHSLTSALGGE